MGIGPHRCAARCAFRRMVDLSRCARARTPALRDPRADATVPRARLSFVDALRLVAAVQMIQGHTLDALLAPELRQGPWFSAWTFARGLTSTAFLFTAGLSFALAHAASAERGEVAQGRARRTRRALVLIALGYLLRAPLGILLGDAPGEALANFLAVDVLQCIGVSLLFLEGLFVVVQSRRRVAAMSGLLGSLCFALAPLGDRLHADLPWSALTNYLTARDGSLFPLLPAAGFVFWGLTIAESALGLGLFPAAAARSGARVGQGYSDARPALRLLAWGTLVLAGGWCLGALTPALATRVSPAHALLKLGLVLMCGALMAGLLAGRKLPHVLRLLASETLFLYVSHVLVLYAGHVGLAALVGRSQSLGAALAWCAGLLIFASLGALSYERALRALRARFQSGTPRPQSPLPLG